MSSAPEHFLCTVNPFASNGQQIRPPAPCVHSSIHLRQHSNGWRCVAAPQSISHVSHTFPCRVRVQTKATQPTELLCTASRCTMYVMYPHGHTGRHCVWCTMSRHKVIFSQFCYGIRLGVCAYQRRISTNLGFAMATGKTNRLQQGVPGNGNTFTAKAVLVRDNVRHAGAECAHL